MNTCEWTQKEADKSSDQRFRTGSEKRINNRLLSKLALFEKISIFWTNFLENFERICWHMVEKFYEKDVKKGNFCKQMKFWKKSNIKLEWAAILCRHPISISFYRIENYLKSFIQKPLIIISLTLRKKGQNEGARDFEESINSKSAAIFY